MSETEGLTAFVVDFVASSHIEDKDMHLTFFNPVQNFLNLKTNYLSKLSKRIKNIDWGYNLSNIKHIDTSCSSFHDFKTSYIILARKKNAKEGEIGRRGYLVSTDGDGKHHLVGIWPYKLFLEVKDSFSEIEEDLEYLINHLNEFSELLLLRPK